MFFPIVAVAGILARQAVEPANPLEFGRRELAAAAGARMTDIRLTVQPNGRREEYRITVEAGKATIVGSDPNGAMYGACEFAERLRNEAAKAWSEAPVAGKPFLIDRGLNLFLTQPWNYAKNDTDDDVAALTDSNRWWFQNEDYWRTLLDLMARSRLNWLDIHGTWDISSTGAPNLYAYFVTSKTFPLVGVPPEVKARDMAQLNHVIEMAHARGIRVSLMAYEANLRIPQNPRPPYADSEDNVYTYTREVVERMIRQAPKLDAIGFRIGESGRRESFFRCYGEAVKNSGRDIPLITRSWITTKQNVLPLARASKDFTVEIKYNGEQWGAPYPVMGGRMANWGTYSFQDYLSDSGPSSLNARTWSGWPAEGGGQWPSEPYKVVWQVRANGTHRIFPFYNPNWVRRSIQAMKMGTVSGYTIEGMDAYFPKSPDYYLANPADKYCDWIHQRDELWWMTWGRLGYDPSVPDKTFDHRAKALLGGGDSAKWVTRWKNSSLVVSQAYMAHALGPDHRDHAPELEWGGDTDTYMHTGGLDTESFAPLDEDMANRTTSGTDGRHSLEDWQEPIDNGDARDGGLWVDWLKSHGRMREVQNTVKEQTELSGYYGTRFEQAFEWAAFASGQGNPMDPSQSRGMSDEARLDLLLLPGLEYGDPTKVKAGSFVPDGYRKPFTDKLRMHTNAFSWDSQAPLLRAEKNRLSQITPQKPLYMAEPSRSLKISARLAWTPSEVGVSCRLRGSGFDSAWLLVKPLPSSTFWHRKPMKKVGDVWEASFPREHYGYAIAAEVAKGKIAARYPDALKETPYLVIPAQPGPTPQVYDAGEAPAFFDSSRVDPSKYGGMLIGVRAEQFFRQSAATKRKFLDPVERGMRLVILQEDFSRRKLDWLPKPLAVQAHRDNVFDPAGAYGLPKVEHPDVLGEVFVPSAGWEILGNGGLARMRYGAGEILVTTARVMQNMQYPDAAKAFVRFLSLGGTERPTILVDSCSEGSVFTSSCHPDLMNSHGIPFLTLGEVIAKEQGMNSFTPIPGPQLNDDVLNDKGAQMANAFLKARVEAMAKRTDPATVAEFERERARRKHELMRSLGLDPMPARTPLNARVTGTIPRNGYHIEKLVFESRPRFFVTAHVYVPDHPAAPKLPVIVHVNGHWAHKKDEDRIQLRCAFCALQGYLAIAVDSPGYSFEGGALIERRAEGDHNDFALVEGGSCATGYYVWDAMRALDYMATRPDADMTRVGITGASGGGLATLYAFAADDRYKAAVPVVYMASLELQPDNGCLCNHVPGTCQIGDRSDVLAIQAPKPVYLMGAQNDGEFPPDATRLTYKKLQPTWSLFGHASDTYLQIFAGGHDYNQPMREAMIGFFNRYVRGDGDGSPVPQPPLEAIDPENRGLLALDPPAANERTMRDLSLEYLDQAPAPATAVGAIEVNGGLSSKSPLNYHETGTGSRRYVTFEAEGGLTTPGVLVLPPGNLRGIRIIASDAGKAAEMEASGNASDDGFGRLYIDVLGTGELSPIEMRYCVYMGRSPAFIGGEQLASAAEAMEKYSRNIEVVGHGPLSSQAAMYAGILDPALSKVVGYGCLHRWQDAFADGFPDAAIQPRAHLIGSLDSLRALVRHGEWHF